MLDQQRIEAGLARTMKGRIAHDDELGIRYAATADGRLALRLPYAPFLTDGADRRAIAAGGLVTLLDSVCGVGAMAALDFREAVATLDLRIDYLRPPQPETDVLATANLVQSAGLPGRGSVTMRGAAWQDGEEAPLASAIGLFIRRPLRAAADLSGTYPPSGAYPPSGTYPPAPLATADSYGALMGFDTTEQGHLRLPFRPGLVGNGSLPSLHGGAVAAHLQEAARAAVAGASKAPFALMTAHFAFLRFGGPADLRACPEMDRLGASVASVRVVSFQQDAARPTATGSFTFFNSRHARTPG